MTGCASEGVEHSWKPIDGIVVDRNQITNELVFGTLLQCEHCKEVRIG